MFDKGFSFFKVFFVLIFLLIIAWPNDNPAFNDGKDWEARYEEEEFLNVLNDNHWRIVDLPTIDFDSIYVE